ncbi:uncharacterized protein G2W53_039603 [Senna tora]|uniref:Uncharacterized protein n=1 Tax=Senna tora TaxID=362788 RepID=A0A834W2Y3_9FABA|nr:uncharacterized protein G2W53_039603 [Senna tora]
MRVEQEMKNRSGDKKEEVKNRSEKKKEKKSKEDAKKREGGGKATAIEGFGVNGAEWDDGDLAGQLLSLGENDVDGVEQKTVAVGLWVE